MLRQQPTLNAHPLRINIIKTQKPTTIKPVNPSPEIHNLPKFPRSPYRSYQRKQNQQNPINGQINPQFEQLPNPQR